MEHNRRESYAMERARESARRESDGKKSGVPLSQARTDWARFRTR